MVDARSPKMFSNLMIEDRVECTGILVSSTLVFSDCCFAADFRLFEAQVHGNIWFLNCSFEQHFSLRGSVVEGNVAFHGCDFSGSGGVSFRGVRAKSIFLDYGTRGSNDALWLNEMELSGSLVVNGKFSSRVQFRGLQSMEEQPLKLNPSVGRVFFGRSAYFEEHSEENRFDGGIEVRGYEVSGEVEFADAVIDELWLEELELENLQVTGCRISRDLVARKLKVRDKHRGIDLSNNDVERHIQISGGSLECRLNLDNTWVGQVWRLELDDPGSGVPEVSLRRFIAGSALFDPVRLVYGARPRYHFFRPPDIAIVEGARSDFRHEPQRRQEIAEAYTALKNWLAHSGQLREEDHAFFYMRNANEASPVRRFAFGFLFGWGIYLRNIVVSAILVVCMFAIVYVFLGVSPHAALMLSAQAFVASIFGAWPPFSPTELLSLFVTIETFIGVLFITAIVGAYIRKLLR